MKFKKTIVTTIIITTLVSLQVTLFNESDFSDKSAMEKDEVNAKSHNEKTGGKNHQEAVQRVDAKQSNYEALFVRHKPQGVDERRWDVFKNNVIRKWNDTASIDYYCQVIDQYNNPVKDATVEFKIQNFSKDIDKILTGRHPWEDSIIKIKSDNSGLVHLTGIEGARFKINNIFKEGYIQQPFYAYYLLEKNDASRRPQSSLESPVVFYLLNEELSEPLYNQGNYKSIKYGEVWEIDILQRNKKGATPKQVNLRISGRKLKEQYNTKDWEITVEPPEGIEITLASEHDCIANGLSSDNIIVKNEDLDYKGILYIFFHDLNEDFYSKIKIEVNGNRETARVRFYSYSNPIKGSKNLAYVKEKRLRKWPGVIEQEK